MLCRNRNTCAFLAKSAVVRSLFLLILAGALALPGCTHIEYSRTGQTKEALSHDPYANTDQTYSMQLKAQELVLLDGTGGFCSAMATSSAASSARMDAERKLIEKGGYSTSYSYRVYSPAEFSGLNCGIYYKWGTGQAERNYVWPGDGGGEVTYNGSGPVSWGEGGLQFSGAEPIKDIPWLRRSIAVRLGMGKFTFGTFTGNSGGYEMADQAEFSFHTPVTVGLLAFPRKLYGLGAHVHGGADPLGWLLTRSSGAFYKKFDYGGELSYVLALKYLSFSVWGGWQRANHVWGDFWVKNNEWKVTGMLQVNLGPIRGK